MSDMTETSETADGAAAEPRLDTEALGRWLDTQDLPG